MKFAFRQGLIWIPIEIIYEGQAVKIQDCIIDTGSATTAIDIDLVAFDYRKPAIIRRLCGLGGGTQEVVCQQIECVKIEAAVLSDVEIEFGDISSQFGINGFIGNDILRRFSFSIDFPNRELHFHNFCNPNEHYAT